MKDDEFEGNFLLFVRIYKQLDAMVQNGILLTFTRLATVCLSFLDVPLSFLCLSLSHPPERCTYGCSFQNPPNQSLRTAERLVSVCLLTTLQDQTWAYYLWVSIYIFLSTLCTLCFKAFSAPLQPCRGFLIPTTPSLLFPLSPSARLFICIFLCVCGESSGIRWTRRSSQRDGLFSALNEIWQLEYAIHNLIYPPNWKAREELIAGEGSAVCFADLGQLTYLKMLSVCCELEFKVANVYS